MEMLGGERKPFSPGLQILSDVPDLVSSRKVKSALKSSDLLSTTGTAFFYKSERLNTRLGGFHPSGAQPCTPTEQALDLGTRHMSCRGIYPTAHQELLSGVGQPPVLQMARQAGVS